MGDEDRWRDRSGSRMSWLWFSCLALLVLLPPVSLAEAYLWKSRPFRANDTDHSGGDHICDLRRDSNADGKPDRLGDYVTVSGTVIVEPSTFENDGSLFWIREQGCGILVRGQSETLQLGDSVMIRGWVRISDEDCVSANTGLTTLAEATLESECVKVRCRGGDHSPVAVPVADLAACPARRGGNLVRLDGSAKVIEIRSAGADRFAQTSCGDHSFIVYLDQDTGCSLTAGCCYRLTGVFARIMIPCGSNVVPVWCVLPRNPGDVPQVGCWSALVPTEWGQIKSRYRGGQPH